jgi:hypothetical protein
VGKVGTGAIDGCENEDDGQKPRGAPGFRRYLPTLRKPRTFRDHHPHPPVNDRPSGDADNLGAPNYFIQVGWTAFP